MFPQSTAELVREIDRLWAVVFACREQGREEHAGSHRQRAIALQAEVARRA